METDDTVALLAAAPATAYREYLYRPRGEFAHWIGDQFEIVARPGQPIGQTLQEGDVLLKITLGYMRPGRCTTLTAGDLERVASQPTLPYGQLLLRPRRRVEMSEPLPVEPVVDIDEPNPDRGAAFVQPTITVPDSSVFDEPQPTPPQPTITTKEALVLVRKPYTNPARRRVVLKASHAFNGSGAFTVSKPGLIQFFDAATAGKAVVSGTTFTSDQLIAGVTIFAEGVKASDDVDDVVLRLSLTVDGTRGQSAMQKMTVVELFLDIHQSRTSRGTLPAPLAVAQKLNPGRFVHLQDAGFHHGRAMITVRQPKPADFSGTLELNALDATSPNPRVRLFGATDEIAAAGQVSLGATTKITKRIPPAGVRFWVEGAQVSAAQHDSGFQLGIEGIEHDGDRVGLTVVQFSNLQAAIPGTPPHKPRLLNQLPAPHVFTVGPNGFDEDPMLNPPLPLVENSVVGSAPVLLTVTITPAGTPVRWSAQRASGITAASGGDDAASIVALHAAKAPTIRRTPGNDRQATLLANNTGTFHVRPFVDCNGNDIFDHHIDREPNMVLNLVLGRATLFKDHSRQHHDPQLVRTASGEIISPSGTFDIAHPEHAAIHMNAEVDVVTGGADGRRVIGQFFADWFNNIVAPTLWTLTYTDPGHPVPPHAVPFVFCSNAADAHGPGGEFIPGDLPPKIVDPPILDSGRPHPGTGGDSAALVHSQIRNRTPRAVGERWIVEAVDSPGTRPGAIGGTHPVIAAAQLTGVVTQLRFACHLTLWTNLNKQSAPTGHPADRQYAVLERINWQMDGQWTINPATGAITQVTTPATSITSKATTSPAIAVAGTTEEVRPPAAVPLGRKDAQS